MKYGFLEEIDSFYFIGIGGVSMSALAKFLLTRGKIVAGSDACPNEYTDELSRLGAKISVGRITDDVSAYQAVVYTDAIPFTDARLMQAHKLNKIIFSRGEFLKKVSLEFGKVIAVSGCHGKTTCTAMLSHVFYEAGKKFAAHIGGSDNKFSNFYINGYDYFITEACEYKKNFLLLKPDIALVLNEGADHLECYGSRENLIAAYNTFLNSAKNSVALYGVFNGTTFGFDNNADYRADNLREYKGKFSFDLYEEGVKAGEVNLKVYGKHNVLNACAAIAAARLAGIDFETAAKALNSFTGVQRRFENIGYVRGAQCIADYAHHPEEIYSAIESAKKITDGNLVIVFQPHTYSRTKNLFEDFLKVLSPIEKLLIYKTYAAREYFDDSGSALTLSRSLKNSVYGDNVFDIENFLDGLNSSDTVLFLGAGDIYDIAKKVIYNMTAN